jgi:hypothetical protein
MPTYEELTKMSDEELIKGYNDNNPAQPDLRNMLSAQFYRDELVRREQSKATQAMLWLTKVIIFLTAVMLLGLGVQIWLAWK